VLRILIADDHAMVRAGIRQYLENEPSVQEIGEAASGRDTLDQLRQQEWSLVLLDIHMPDQNGLEILRRIQEEHPKVRVLVLSGLPEKQYAVSVLRAGASGYLPKDSAPEDLIKAVHVVLAGRRYVSSEVAELLVAGIDKDPCSPQHERLSSREFQVLNMGLKTNADLTSYALRHGLIQ
jgi:two-component system, NarL family, invasion response regulator UvrY